jgi:hypothetical protein
MAMGGFFRIAPLAQSVDEGGSCEWMVAIRKISKLCANSICSFWEY